MLKERTKKEILTSEILLYKSITRKYFPARIPYKSNGYMSEPEPNYDSDYSIKYQTLDRRRTPSTGSHQYYEK